MKKFFIVGLLFLMSILSPNTFANVRSAADTAPSGPIVSDEKSLQKLYQEIPDLNDSKAVQKYLEKRLKIVESINLTPEELASPSAISVIDVNALKEKDKHALSAYEKIYQESQKRAAETSPLNKDTKIDGEFYDLVPQNTMDKPFIPDFPHLTVKLSNQKEIVVPAEEHIAYLMTTINVESTGLMRVTEEFTIVSNNEDYPHGFYRILPKYTYSRKESKRRLDFSLDSVTVNNEEIPYKITEIGNYLYILPERNLDLPTGIHTYRFNYTIDRAVWFYKKFDEFYWDISSKTIKSIIGSANAVVILPEGNEFMAQNAFHISSAGKINPKRVSITNLTANTLGFSDTGALAPGDDINITITLNKGTLITPDFSKKYFWFIQDFGAELFALLVLIAVYFSYKISLKQIRQNKDKTRLSVPKTPAIFRMFNVNIYDTRSLLAQILDLEAKNVIDIRTDKEKTVLIKKTDNLKKFPRSLRMFTNTLFPGAEVTLFADNTARLKLARAYNLLRRIICRQYRLYILKLNAPYLISSTAMMLLGIVATASISVNPRHTFWIIFCCTLLLLFFILLFSKNCKRKWQSWLIKALSVLFVIFIGGWLAIYTSRLYAVLIIISLYCIKKYHTEFSRRSGLLRNKIKETEEYKSYLQKNPELTLTARDFRNRVPYIYAFGIENKYPTVTIFTLIKQYEDLLTK